MKKFLKIFSFFFSFCFINSVYALDSFTMGNGTVINQEYVQNLWNTYFKGKSCKDITNSSSTYPSMTKPYEDGIFNYVLISPINNNNIYIGFFDKSQIYYVADYGTQENFEVGNPSPDTGYDCSPSMNFNTSTNTVEFYKRNFIATLQIKKNSSAHTCTYNSGFKMCYNNFDLIYNDKNYLSNNFNYTTTPTEYYARIHLNGGIYANLSNIPIEMYLEDFDTPVFTDLVEASAYFYELVNGDSETPKPGINFSNDGMIFDGLFFEPNFRHEFIYSFTEDIQNLADEHDLYVKWRYNSYDSLIENETLLNMTYDDNYSYMYITHQNSSDIYIGLPFNDMLVSAYGYNSETNTYNQESAIGLTPLFEKDGYYYYILRNDDRFDNWVMVVERNSFQNNNYNFKITNNAYITYGNDLTNAEININGNLINTNINDVFGSAKDEYINNSNDLISTLKNLIGNHKSLIQTFSDVFDKLKGTQLWNYFMLLIVGVCIIMIIRTANRK